MIVSNFVTISRRYSMYGFGSYVLAFQMWNRGDFAERLRQLALVYRTTPPTEPDFSQSIAMLSVDNSFDKLPLFVVSSLIYVMGLVNVSAKTDLSVPSARTKILIDVHLRQEELCARPL